MEPLNNKERTTAIWKMIGLFTCTLAILIWAIYFNTRAPIEELKRLRQEREQLKSDMRKVDEVIVLMAGVNQSYAENRDNLALFSEEIVSDLTDVKRGKDDTAQIDGRLRNKLFETVGNIRALAQKTGEQAKELEDLGDCPQKLKECKEDRNTIQGQLDNIRKSQ